MCDDPVVTPIVISAIGVGIAGYSAIDAATQDAPSTDSSALADAARAARRRASIGGRDSTMLGGSTTGKVNKKVVLGE